MSERRTVWNVIANLFGSVWMAALSLLFIPIYLRFLGPEAFGLVGVLAALQSIFGTLDLGLGAALNREMARLSVSDSDGTRERDLLRTLEVVYWGFAVVSGLAVLALSGTIAHRWVHAQHLPAAEIAQSMVCMGFIVALQFPFATYQAGLLGRQRQVALNVVNVTAATLRSVGAVLLIWLVAPSIRLFFEWQALIMALQVAVMAALLWRDLPAMGRRARIRFALVAEQWKFSAAIGGNAILGAILTQSDKMILSGILPLAQFGYYTLAGTVAAALWYVINPIATAFYPRFTQLLHAGDESAVVTVYHRACQFMAVLLLPVAITIAAFAGPLILIWTRNAVAAAAAGTLAALLVCGTMINGMAALPSYFSAAAGCPQIIAYTNLIAIAIFIPALLLTAPRFGALAAAAIWVVVNAFYVLITVPLLHRRVIPHEKWRWYSVDFAQPLLAAAAVGVLSRLLFVSGLSTVLTLLWLAATGVCVALAVALVLPEVRNTLMTFFHRTAVFAMVRR